MVAFSIVTFESSDVTLMVCGDELASDSQMAPEFAVPGNSRQRKAAVCQGFSCLICRLVKSPGIIHCSNLFPIIFS